MAIPIFTPPPEALAAALRQSGAQPQQASVPAQPAVPTFTQPQLPPAVPQESPWMSKYSDSLISSATDVNNPVGHWFEGVGRLAQLTSGFYQKSKEEGRRAQREKAFDAYMDKNHPELAEAHRYGSAEERTRLRDMATKLLVARSEEARTRARDDGDFASMRKLALNDPNLDPYMREAILNPQTSKEVLKEIFAQQRERAKEVAQGARDRAKFERDYQEGLRIFNGDEPRARLFAHGVKNPSSMEGLNRAAGAGGQQRLNEKGEPRPDTDPLAHAELYESAPPDQYGRAYADELATGRKRSDALSTETAQAASTVSALDQAEQAMSRVRTGAFAQQEHIARKVLHALGVEDANRIAAGETMTALRLTFARGARVGFPGSVTEKEMEWYFGSSPGLDKTKEGNQIIIMGLRHNAMKPFYEQEDRRAWAKARRDAGLPVTFGTGFAAWHEVRMLERKAEVVSKISALMDSFGLKSKESNVEKLQRERAGIRGAPVPLPGTDAQLRGPINDVPAITQPRQITPPDAAIQDLASNPTPEMRRYFDEMFGPGAADRAIGALR